MRAITAIVLCLWAGTVIGGNVHHPNSLASSSSSEEISRNGVQTSTSSLAQEIPGTDLTTNTFYKLGIRTDSRGIISWTATGSDPHFNYAMYERASGQLPLYQPGGVYHQDLKWLLVPEIKHGAETGWYKLRNRSRPCMRLTFNPWLSDDQTQTQVHYVVVEDDYRIVNNRKQEDMLLKPERVNVGGTIYYRIKIKSLPGGYLTFSYTILNNRDMTRYLVVNVNPSQASNFREGGVWFDHALFRFSDPEPNTDVLPDQ